MITAKEARKLKEYNSKLNELTEKIIKAAKGGNDELVIESPHDKVPYSIVLEDLVNDGGYEVKIERKTRDTSGMTNWGHTIFECFILTIKW